MRIIHIASECAPHAKSGGLGDVVYGLSKKTFSSGIPVDIIIPDYFKNETSIKKTLIDSFEVRLNRETYTVYVHQSKIENLNLFLIDSSHPENLFGRNKIYGEKDDTHRFLCFNYFALSFLDRINFSDKCILHTHDWPTGFSNYLLKNHFTSLKKKIIGSVLTIHNLKHQGITSLDHLKYFNISPENLPLNLLQNNNPNYVNLLKGAIDSCDSCVIVSPGYLKEIQTSEYGEGLQDFIKSNISKFSAILNGIDTDYWNPKTDLFIYRNYSTNSLIETVLEEKYKNKHHLQKILKLNHSHQPLFIFITRLVEQKSPHLILEAIKIIQKLNCQCVLLGSEPNDELKNQFSQIDDKNNIYIDFRFDETLSHLCYSAADAIIIPSIYEPCGLTQMIGMRYGTIPIVRKTGGLSDTVFDIEHSQVLDHQKNGFVFEYPTLDSMDYIVKRAVKCYNEQHSIWKKLARNCLDAKVDFEEPAKKYISLYQSIFDSNKN